MSVLLDDNLQRLAILLQRAFPPETTAISLHRILEAFVEQRNTSPQPQLYDERTNQFLRAIEPTTGPGSDPQIIINHLVDLHDAG